MRPKGLGAHARVIGGEVVIFFGKEDQMHGEAPRASYEKVRSFRQKDNQEATTHNGEYTVHKGQFKFHYRKELRGSRVVNDARVVVDLEEEEDPRFSGEYYIDPEYAQRVNSTQIVF